MCVDLYIYTVFIDVHNHNDLCFSTCLFLYVEFHLHTYIYIGIYTHMLLGSGFEVHIQLSFVWFVFVCI